ncbi:MAG: DUF4185 domain-containing protein [Ferruginibacter sp.]
MAKIAMLLMLFFTACSPKINTLTLHRKISYPESKLIKRLVWESEPSRYPGSGTDMHWWTLGIDSNLYLIDDDGANFGGPGWYAHLLKASGVPPGHKVETVNDFQSYDFRANLPDKLVRRYVCGVVAVDSSLYVSIYDYNWNIPSKSVNKDTLVKLLKQFHPWNDMSPATRGEAGFIDGYSKNYGVAGIIQSRDFGKTWTRLPGKNTPEFFGNKFGAPAFLTFGPGNTQTPGELTPYVYAISNDVNWASGDNVFLGRVHRDSVAYRKAWQFYKGNTNRSDPLWSGEEHAASPVFSDPGHVGHPTITYNKALGRYILCISSDMVPHRENASKEEARKWNWESEMQLYESLHPWGPWSIFHNERQWGGKEHTAYLPQMPSNWISKDGLSGSILFAGDYVNRKAAYYGFMTQQFRLELR